MQYRCNNTQRSRAASPRELIMEIWPQQQQQQPRSRTRSLPHVTFRGASSRAEMSIVASKEALRRRESGSERVHVNDLLICPLGLLAASPSAPPLSSPILNFPSGHRFFFLLLSLLRGFFSRPRKSLFCSTVATQSGSAV